MSLPLLLLAALLMQQTDTHDAPKLKKPQSSTPQSEDGSPPEEDESAKPKEYSFNPIQAKREVSVGDYYMKVKKDYKGAAARYEEATHWNGQFATAYRKLGEAEEKLDEPKLAREAYQKFLEISPDSKEAADVKKRLQKIPAS